MRKTQLTMRLFAVTVACAAASTGQGQTIELATPQLVARCTVTDEAPAGAPIGGAGMLMAVCGGSGTLIGPATTYSATTNAAKGSVLVVRQRSGRSSVLLVSPMAGGRGAHVDNVTRDLAILGGRAGDLGLGAMSVDTGRFATNGSVGITSGGVSKSLDLTSYVGRAATMLGPAPAITNDRTAGQ